MKPKFVQRWGKNCSRCHRRISIKVRYDMYYVKNKDSWFEDFSWITSLCECGCYIFYRNGAVRFIAKNKFKSEIALMNKLKKIPSLIDIKTGNIKDFSQIRDEMKEEAEVDNEDGTLSIERPIKLGRRVAKNV